MHRSNSTSNSRITALASPDRLLADKDPYGTGTIRAGKTRNAVQKIGHL
jgi:hypothetical protein